MESNKILQADILDILFEGKNKEYGAYELRKTYNRRLFKAIIVTGSVIVLLFIGGMVNGFSPKRVALVPVGPDIELKSVEKPKEIPPVIPPAVKVPPVATVQFTPPRIVPADQVKPEDVPPVQDDMDKVKIGAETKAGADFDGTMAPPDGPPGDGGKGIVEEKKPAEPEIWEKVEIDASYPGGMPAWQRFMYKNFRYPDDGQNNEIQGTVVVQFVVDEKGNVSNVVAISGPETGGLREEAVRVIKKSGLWVPAIQNGRQVKAYKRQPIVFKMTE